MKRLLLLCVLVLASLGASPVASAAEEAAGPTNEDCLNCHGEKDLKGKTPRGRTLNLFVEPDALKFSVHKELSCTDCHGGALSFDTAPHNDGNPLSFKCGTCHAEPARQYRESVHGVHAAQGDLAAATCGKCHGGHDILPSANRQSRTNHFNLPGTCGKCHQNPELLKTRDIKQKEAVAHFSDSIHGKALMIAGLGVAPSCNDCHGVHDIQRASDPRSHIFKDNVPKTCGKCHVLVEEIYSKSIHGQLLKQFDQRGPICTTCHTSHEIVDPGTPEFRMKADEKCGGCHKDRLARYRETFHGKAIALGRPGVATCFDCHGHHDIQKSSDPTSHVSDANRLGTCKKCHASANAEFANYIVHADHTDKKDHPQLYYLYLFMTVLLLGTFAFFALHSLLWLFRSMALFTGDSKEWKEEKLKARTDPEQYVRFKPVDRFLHGLVIFSFILLVLTGMPLKFYYADWAKWLLGLMGGQQVAALAHRLGALITIFYFTVHVLTVAVGFWRGRGRWRDPETKKFSVRRLLGVVFGPDSPMPNFRDLKDFVAHQKWFFGKGPKPEFDRWTYWEKFDYLAVFWGVAVIGLSGLVMWFPARFTAFLPGWIINAALIIHSDEALLAAGFIFTFHFFNVHFRPEKFPLDPVIFSGRISKTELLQERKGLYDRWEKEGRLGEMKVKDEWESWKWIALPAGFLAFCIGVGLVIMIYYAMVQRLGGG
ncbi:MAG TPA: hypothetical protein VGK67_22005 [Myxococcales bacterium]|jgi:cytochrome b subunit of formate dehydrogenase